MDKISQFDIWSGYRSYIEHEDTLIDKRSMWNLLTQAFLFAAYASLIAKIVDCLDAKFDGKDMDGIVWGLAIFAMIIAALGILKASLAILGVNAAAQAIDNLERSWKEIDTAYRQDWQEKGKLYPFPFITGGSESPVTAAVVGKKLSRWMCTSFIATWILTLPVTLDVAIHASQARRPSQDASATTGGRTPEGNGCPVQGTGSITLSPSISIVNGPMATAPAPIPVPHRSAATLSRPRPNACGR